MSLLYDIITRLLILYCFCVALVLCSNDVYAIDMDYVALQDLFGEPVTTTATGKPQKATESPISIKIITAEQIRRSGATSITDVLKLANGLSVWSPSRGSSEVGIRGQNTSYNPSILVMINGRQVYDDSYGYTSWSVLPVQLEEIIQIEVVKGPSSALYGFNAATGVINIITSNPLFENLTKVGTTVGSDKYGKLFGVQTVNISDKAGIRLSGSVERFDEYDLVSATNIASTSTIQDNINKKLMMDSAIKLNDNTSARFEASYAFSQLNESPLYYSIEKTDKDFYSGRAIITSNTDYGQLEFNLYNNTARNEFLSGEFPGDYRNNVTVAQVQDLFKVGTEHTIRLQGEYRHNLLESDEYIGKDAQVFYNLYAAGAMWNWALNPRLEVTNAIRLDHMSLNRSGAFPTAVPFASNSEFDNDVLEYSLNSGLLWKISGTDSVKFSFARGIQAPSLFKYGFDIASTPFVVAGNPDISSSVVTNYEIGYNKVVESLDLNIETSLFFRNTEDVSAVGSEFRMIGFTPVLGVETVGDSNTMGAEFMVLGKINSEFSWDIGYIYQDTYDDFKASARSNPSLSLLHFEDMVPNHHFKAHIAYTMDRWEVDLYGELASNFDVLYSSTPVFVRKNIDGYHSVSSRVAYNFDNGIVLAASGMNITQDAVQNSFGLENQRVLFVSLSKNF